MQVHVHVCMYDIIIVRYMYLIKSATPLIAKEEINQRDLHVCQLAKAIYKSGQNHPILVSLHTLRVLIKPTQSSPLE